ncbi:hypothetical protein H920_01533 [Fukomys damarensis]|uniref:Uncharacterized protein n=1 Tax=Fukomys damarensis TaxID=885580 RepID=A0A091E137_FUKDA|nr:hypothetical protein H920_01533 [Fukomys damarensis]
MKDEKEKQKVKKEEKEEEAEVTEKGEKEERKRKRRRRKGGKRGVEGKSKVTPGEQLKNFLSSNKGMDHIYKRKKPGQGGRKDSRCRREKTMLKVFEGFVCGMNPNCQGRNQTRGAEAPLRKKPSKFKAESKNDGNKRPRHKTEDFDSHVTREKANDQKEGK